MFYYTISIEVLVFSLSFVIGISIRINISM